LSSQTPGVYWHSRGYLPHFEAGEIPQSITFRLADSLPAAALERLQSELSLLPDAQAVQERRRRIELLLDQGRGERHLGDACVADVVEAALLHFDGTRYRLHAWCIMPNHVHVLITPQGDQTLSRILQSWKSFTANRANVLLGRTGTFWAADYHDRYIRDEAHYANALSYIALNPVKAGLCSTADEWRYSSSWAGRAKGVVPGTADILSAS
jgi:putative DNA methylase